jgi:hypothetical protein
MMAGRGRRAGVSLTRAVPQKKELCREAMGSMAMKPARRIAVRFPLRSLLGVGTGSLEHHKRLGLQVFSEGGLHDFVRCMKPPFN